MNENLTENIKKLVQKGKENGFILISELNAIIENLKLADQQYISCLLYTSPSPRDTNPSRMPSSA